jgi:hypothetical protein
LLTPFKVLWHHPIAADDCAQVGAEQKVVEEAFTNCKKNILMKPNGSDGVTMGSQVSQYDFPRIEVGCPIEDFKLC